MRLFILWGRFVGRLFFFGVSEMAIKGLIYLGGKMGSGKGRLADELVKLDPRYHSVAVAEALKQGAGDIVGVPYNDANKWAFRPLLTMVNDVKIALGVPPGWIEKTFQLAEERGHEYLIINDGRKSEELAFIRRANVPYVTVRLSCPEDVRAARVAARDGAWPSEAQLNHITERELDSYPFDILLDSEIYEPQQLAKIFYVALANLRHFPKPEFRAVTTWGD